MTFYIMAKHCSVCDKKLGILDGKIAIADGIVCTSCWTSASLDMGFQSMKSAKNKTTNQIKDLIEIEVLKKEAEKAGLNKKKDKNVKPMNKRKAIKSVEETIEHKLEPKPIDIVIAVDENKGVGFWCEGTPIINFDDLVNGKEMIIGDGYINNESANPLPEVRIACKFEPAIIDSGLIYYESGTFEAGAKGKFEIDDPPVNLEEYAKIKTATKGKVAFTLFLGEQEMHTVECEMQVEPAPAEEMKRLMNAIMYQEAKNASGPVNVFLYARENGAFDVDLMRHPELLYSMYSNGKEQLIDDVIIVNDSKKVLKNVKFEANFTSNILSSVDVLLGDVPAGEMISFEVDDPAIDVDKLEMLTEIETCIATYKLRVNGKLIAESTGKITICPYNQWNAALILLPAYMTPNHPNIISVLQNASKWMLINGMNPSLEGYQSDGKRVEEMVGAVYNAVKEANIIYSNPPASFFGPQRIRLCETIFEQRFATCMDMTILFASCLESFGLHPILITAPGHIFAGVWLTAKGRLKEPVLSDAKLIQKYIEDGQLVAIECTAMNVGKDISYEEAKTIANNTIKLLADNNIEDHECVDVQIARAMGVRPLPLRVHHQSSIENTVRTEDLIVQNSNAIVSSNETVIASDEEEKVAIETSVSTVEEATAEQSSVVETPILDELATREKVLYTQEEYKVFVDDLSHISIDNFYEKQSKKLLKDAIVKIVEVEGPISQPALIKTLINATSLGRTSKQITEHLDKLVSSADVKITRQAGVRFLWISGSDPSDYFAYRIKEQRNPEDVCKYELKNAVCYLIQQNGPMTKEEITKAMVSMFGYSRSSKKIEEGASAAIKAARELKAIEQNDKKQFVLV